MFLEPYTRLNDPHYRPPSQCPGLQNALMQGISFRNSWDKVEQVKGTRDWSYFDAAIDAVKTTGKKISFHFLSGFYSPAWLFSEPGVIYFEMEETHGQMLPIPLPFDPAYQAIFGERIMEMGDRYYGLNNTAYWMASGFARKAESNFCANQADYDALTPIAQGLGHATVEAAWLSGFKWFFDKYKEAFPNLPMLLVLDPPFQGSPALVQIGHDTLQAACDYINTTYPEFISGVTTHALGVNSPDHTSIAWTEISKRASTSRCGGQLGGTQGTYDKLNGAVLHGTSAPLFFHWIEYWEGDAQAPWAVPILTVARDTMLSM